MRTLQHRCGAHQVCPDFSGAACDAHLRPLGGIDLDPIICHEETRIVARDSTVTVSVA
jgi:hypothetical protein